MASAGALGLAAALAAPASFSALLVSRMGEATQQWGLEGPRAPGLLVTARGRVGLRASAGQPEVRGGLRVVRAVGLSACELGGSIVSRQPQKKTQRRTTVTLHYNCITSA